MLAHWVGRRLFAAPRRKIDEGAARYVQNASRDERWGPAVRARAAFLTGRRTWCAINTACGAGAIRTGRLRAMSDAPDHLGRWADAFRAETRTLSKQKSSLLGAVQKGSPAPRE